jgi:hypothetical protein
MQKAFQQRRDTVSLFEPFADTYYFSRARHTSMYGDKPEVWDRDFEHVVGEISSVEAPLIFVKEMAYFVTPYVTDGFLEAGTHTFIIRDPILTLASRKKERKDEIGEHEFGFTALHELWQRVVKIHGATVLVNGEHLRKSPESVLKRYCQRIGVEFDEAMLSWQAGPIRVFEEYERQSHARWHRVLDKSTGFVGGAGIGSELDRAELTAGEVAMLERAQIIYNELSSFCI